MPDTELSVLHDMRVQNEPPQDVLLWYMDCFEIKAILVSGSRETSGPSFNT